MSENNILSSYYAFITDGSGWTVEKILSLTLRTFEYEAFSGGTCKDHAALLPNAIKVKNACLAII